MTDLYTPDPRRSLTYLGPEQRQLAARLLALTAEELDRSSNLPGWKIKDLGVHITRVCDSILKAVQRARVGDHTPAFGAAARTREEEIRAMSPSEWVDLQCSACGEIKKTVAQLSVEQLERFDFPHPQGLRSIRWFCTQLLTEVVFHRWDLECALGTRAPLDESMAAYLLPFLLDAAEPIFGIVRTDIEATFVVSSGPTAWRLHSTPEGTTVQTISAGAVDAPIDDPLVEARPGWLALAVYGRVRIDEPPFKIDGPRNVADRFAATFGPHS
jgi:uncharacterized protein (TIGR03083 family)